MNNELTLTITAANDKYNNLQSENIYLQEQIKELLEQTNIQKNTTINNKINDEKYELKLTEMNDNLKILSNR